MRERVWFLLTLLVFAVSATACLPTQPNPSDPSGCQYAPLIRTVFKEDPDTAVRIAFRESRCQPDARNGSSGSAGLFQLYRHDDLLAQVCPNESPSSSWANPVCNTRAAHLLWEGSGWQPWAL